MRRATAATCACGVVAHRGCARALEACPSLGCDEVLVAPPRVSAVVRRRRTPLHALVPALLATAAVTWAASALSAPPLPPPAAPAPVPVPVAAPRVVDDPLRSPDPIARGEAVLALGGAARLWAVESDVATLLTMAAHDPAPGVRARCDAALARSAERVRGHLVRALEHADPELRLVAADTVGRVPRVWARTALLARVDPQREPDARVRAVAAARLLSIDARTSDVDGDWAALDALASRERDEPDHLVWVILRAGVNERDHASCASVQRVLPSLLDAAARPDRVGSACLDLLRGLGRCDAKAPLLAALEGDDATSRALAATLLGRWLERPDRCLVRDTDVRAGLERACDDAEQEVQLAARGAFAAAEGTRSIVISCGGPSPSDRQGR